MLTSRAPERDHEVFKTAALIIAQAGVHKRNGASEKSVDALLTIKVIDDNSVFACKGLEALLATGIGKASRVEDKPAAITALVFGQSPVK